MQGHRWWVRDGMLVGLVLAAMGSAVVYPMDWGMEYQTWPLPTLYATVCMFMVTQVVEVLYGCMRCSAPKIKEE
jgi:hypothetical protein